jgi:hypothetical protein
VIEDTCRTSQESGLLVLGVNRDDSSLAIHAHNSGVRRVKWRVGGHLNTPFRQTSYIVSRFYISNCSWITAHTEGTQNDVLPVGPRPLCNRRERV